MADEARVITGKLKKGQGLVIQGINGAGQPISSGRRLATSPRPMTDRRLIPRCLKNRQKKLQDEPQRRAEEAQEAEAQPPAAQTR
jgi:hypothetical protein